MTLSSDVFACLYGINSSTGAGVVRALTRTVNNPEVSLRPLQKRSRRSQSGPSESVNSAKGLVAGT